MSERERPPTASGVRRWREWLDTCEELGWPKSTMPFLSDLFWQYKDHNGELKPPTQETPNDR